VKVNPRAEDHPTTPDDRGLVRREIKKPEGWNPVTAGAKFRKKKRFTVVNLKDVAVWGPKQGSPADG